MGGEGVGCGPYHLFGIMDPNIIKPLLLKTEGTFVAPLRHYRHIPPTDMSAMMAITMMAMMVAMVLLAGFSFRGEVQHETPFINQRDA